MADNRIDLAQVRQVLHKFQDGYTKRDLSTLDQFMQLFVQDDELEVIGTGAIVPGEFDWCLGGELTKQIVRVDWEEWGDVQLDLEGARIHILGEVAWVSLAGTVSQTIPRDEAYRNCLERMSPILGRDMEAEARLLEILRKGMDTLAEVRQGDHYIWPLRLTAVLVRRDGDWRFHRMHFSFPTTQLPDARYVDA